MGGKDKASFCRFIARIAAPRLWGGFIVEIGMDEKEKKPIKQIKQKFSSKRMAFMAVFVALSYAVSLVEIPMFTVFFKLDFGNVFILLIGFLLGPIEGVIVCVLKETLRCIGSNSTFVGELANVLVTSAYILLPSIVYQKRKGLKTVIVCLCIACLLGTGAALLANRFITFPLYEAILLKAYQMDAAMAFEYFFWIIIAFNLIKTVSVSFLSVLLYKRLSNFLKKIKI